MFFPRNVLFLALKKSCVWQHCDQGKMCCFFSCPFAKQERKRWRSNHFRKGDMMLHHVPLQQVRCSPPALSWNGRSPQKDEKRQSWLRGKCGPLRWRVGMGDSWVWPEGDLNIVPFSQTDDQSVSRTTNSLQAYRVQKLVDRSGCFYWTLIRPGGGLIQQGGCCWILDETFWAGRAGF